MVTRYECSGYDFDCDIDATGSWVDYEDYEDLENRYKLLQQEFEGYKKRHTVQMTITLDQNQIDDVMKEIEDALKQFGVK